MRRFLGKLFIILILAFFTVINYRYFSFTKGISKFDMNDKTFIEQVEALTNIEKVEYYSKVIADGDKKYNVYVVTNKDAYLFSATENDITALSVTGYFANNVKPQKVTVIPFYVEIICGVVVLFFPKLKRK